MASKKLVNDIRNMINEMNEESHKYGSVWLSYNDDLTGRERYVLNVKMEHKTDTFLSEIAIIVKQLYAKMDISSFQKIARVKVIDADDDVYCEKYDIPIIETEEIYH